MMRRSFAIVPAAGSSLRMGQPKLLLPLKGQPLITHTIDAWLRSGVTRIAVVVRADDEQLAAAVQSLPAGSIDLVLPDRPPPDMKASIQAALTHIERLHRPAEGDCFLVAPADIPRLSPAVAAGLVTHHGHALSQILVPTISGVRGHPVLFPWNLAAEVHRLLENQGLNALIQRKGALELPCDELVPAGEEPFSDIDTPREYQRLVDEYSSGRRTQTPGE